MNTTLNIPWDRYALIAELAKRLKDTSPQFGKTVLQKLIYLLQEAYHISFGYDFELYSYGPFTSQILSDLDLVENFGWVTVQPIQTSTGGYEIKPADDIDEDLEKYSGYLKEPEFDSKIVNLVTTYGNKTARDLELLSTVVYIERSLKLKGETASRLDIANTVKQIKPKFAETEISKAINDLFNNEHIAVVA